MFGLIWKSLAVGGEIAFLLPLPFLLKFSYSKSLNDQTLVAFPI